MPLNKLFQRDAQEASAAEELYALEIREKIVDLREELEVYESDAWARVDKLLADKLERAFRDMMVGDPEQMILARERARVVSDLRGAPQVLRDQIADLQKQLLEVEGE